MPAKYSTCSRSTSVAVGDFKITVSVIIAESNVAAIPSGISIPALRSLHVIMVAEEPTGMLVKRIGWLVHTSPMRW